MKYIKLLLLISFSTFVFAKSTTSINTSERILEFPANGTWQMIAFKMDGEFVADEEVKKWKIKNNGENFTLYFEDSYHSSGVSKIISGQIGKEDFTFIDGPWKGIKHLGIFSVSGNIYKSCYVTSDRARPKEFSSDKNSGKRLATYKRIE